ncbi:metallophosphoesterase [Methanohalophilus portucalensis]|uniref:Serine/threonine protein phosphatase n=2 Tax=Methanohalophilus portucalensis TaxID=39664 RepID=A0A1L9C2U7_9EURY|nr:metallophosphoesterase [Methanohalophilus portucalensis]ATU07672.1 hypothetical protein BKM01_02080 [Methanohalophilus portucalensis]OJH48817.1 hypothetical protein MPF_1665 [Methanohalophilus portucalensis FDF-1]RNI08795.1 serine/threonine protein phosphatase [Methanohalophilus portucalensis FDF-1]SMH36812.1 serine/threonine-protein phosphatase PP1 catalytic subunit [Methanohalophilus portucalensis FDF-1]
MNSKIDTLSNLLPKVADIFISENPVIYVGTDSVMVIGDIHGDLKALDLILKMQKKINCERMIFLGDYIDRGPNSVEVLNKLFRLKIADPDKIILLRGNHETAEMNYCGGFYDELGRDDSLFVLANHVFEEMPIAAIIFNRIFCVHGGIPGSQKIHSIEKYHSFEYIWNDPSELNGMHSSARGDDIKEYGPDITSDFLQINGLELIIRGHSALKEGYKWYFNEKLLSLFSTPNYRSLFNVAAFAVIKDENTKIVVFGTSDGNDYSLLDSV